MAAFLAVWQVLVDTKALDYDYLPAPSAIASAGWSLLWSGELLTNLFHTLRVTLLGWAAACPLGITLGIWLGLWNTAWRYSMSSIEVLRAVPPVSLVPVALLLFGFSIKMELTIIVYASAWPVLVNTIDGVRSVPEDLLDVARMLRMSRSTTIRKIIVPSGMPSIVVGMRLTLSMSLVLAVVAEMIGNPSGLGNALVSAQQALQPADMFAYVLTIAFLGVALNAAFRYVSARTMPSLTASGITFS
jgi:ABC-type nitrate/sulfonate/bicarbonate transport system permease component